MGDKKVLWTRTKTHEHTHLEAGKGVSESVSKTIRKHPQNESQWLRFSFGRRRRSSASNVDYLRRRSLTPRSVMSEISNMLDIAEYEFPEDDDILDQKIDAKLDVTALDRYNEDIRRIRKLTIDECRMLPQKGDIDAFCLGKIKLIVRSLCRTSHYGTHKAQVLSEGAVVLIVWLLNKKNIAEIFKIHILQSFAEMMWTSLDLKFSLYKCSGMRVLAKVLINGLTKKSEQARWACYTLAMCAIGSSEIIDGVKQIAFFEEAVGEIAFHAYWTNWPANFGSILQGLLYGPHSVLAIEEVTNFI